ncbi:hypothetical protein J2N86_09580 [Legionella lytica]|uniref:Uncharacterized protein n=1 Tax=Legionella lytica TaxID=96232 RepID=A0ABY4Y722_9GAMM|nr:hypothetical protein [Legionella lytica]USQ12952.1 hypothetical protein J2N86_09580 [Legionella lytica]
MHSKQLVETWICDSCDELIQRPEDGRVEWIVSMNEAKDLRLVHHARSGSHGQSCQYNCTSVYQKYKGIINDVSLSMFLGADGLMQLLSLIAEQRLPQNQVLEMIKRLHIPGYEHTRHHFNEAIGQLVFEPNTAPGFYLQHNINAVLEWTRSTNRDA